jgi:outer membrane protein assembly factor BamE
MIAQALSLNVYSTHNATHTTPTIFSLMNTAMRFLHFARPLRSLLAAILIASAILGSSACVYRIPIQQGNFLEPKDVDQVTVGMTQVQVRYVLGTPMVIDPFSQDRWDYVYYLKTTKMRKPEQRHFVVYFEQGTVSRIERPEVPQA